MSKKKCNICYESNVSIIIFGNCSHKVCVNCISKLDKCPFCRGHLPDDIKILDYSKKSNINLDNIEIIVDDNIDYMNSWINMLNK